MAWYHSIVALQTSVFLLSVCTEVRLDIPICSLSAPEGHSIPLASRVNFFGYTMHMYVLFENSGLGICEI